MDPPEQISFVDPESGNDGQLGNGRNIQKGCNDRHEKQNAQNGEQDPEHEAEDPVGRAEDPDGFDHLPEQPEDQPPHLQL